MTRRTKLFCLCILLISLSPILCGCMDALDINKKFIVATVLLDKREEEVWMYLEIVNIQPGKSGSGGNGSSGSGDKYYFVKGHGKTIYDARLDADRQLDQPLYSGGLRTLIFTENYAAEGVAEYLYRIRSDEAARKKVVPVTIQGDVDTLFSAMHEKSQSLGLVLEQTINTLQDNGEAFSVTSMQLTEDISAPYAGVAIPCFALRDKEIALSGYTVINGTKAVGFIPIKETVGLNILKADKAKSLFLVPYQGVDFTVQTDLQSRSITPYYQNGAISFVVALNFDASIEYGDKKTPFNLTDSALKEMETTLEQMIEAQLAIAADQAKNVYRTDYLQLYNAFRIKYPSLYESLQWQDAFQIANFYWKINICLVESSMLDYGPNQPR